MSNVFISGEKINLCVPQEEDFDTWANWFNDQEITKFLEQGKYPNTVEQQKNFYSSSIEQGRFLTLIKTKDDQLLGVISLSDINFEKRSCQVAYVCPVKSSKAVFAALEALSHCTEHAFRRFGVMQVWAGHAFPGLLSWIQKTEILGYKTDGFIPTGFTHGITVSDAVRTSITKERFSRLADRRGGHLWPGEAITNRMLMALKQSKSLAECVNLSIKNIHAQYDHMLDRIETDAQ
jgi:hypothetical protein